jgi:hypothetical protein
METQATRKANQHKRDVARCRARYQEANATRAAFMASDAARFIIQRDWKRTLADMVPATRLERFRRNGGRGAAVNKFSVSRTARSTRRKSIAASHSTK